jgi:HAD superfamily hydrolase (TIGR01509 family)
MPAAVLFGSIGTVAETSELQRAAFNEAFKQHGLDWDWSQDEYRGLLEKSGGQDRIAAYAESKGDEVDAAAVYETKSDLFRQKLADAAPGPRPGVAEVIAAARESGMQTGLVTTTSRANVEALGPAIEPALDLNHFDLVVDKADVEKPKPDGAAYAYALDKLGLRPDQAVAIENNLDGVAAAKAAGIAVVAFPGEDNEGHDFAAADEVAKHLDFTRLRELAGGEAAVR